VLSEHSKQVKYFSAREEKFHIPKQQCYGIYYINTNKIPNHSSFPAKGMYM